MHNTNQILPSPHPPRTTINDPLTNSFDLKRMHAFNALNPGKSTQYYQGSRRRHFLMI